MITTKADSQKRVTIPSARPGQVFAVQTNADGSITLAAVNPNEAVEPACLISKEDGYTVAVPKQPIDEEAIKELLAEFP